MKNLLWRSFAAALGLAFLALQPVLAHEEITAGDYTIEVGWLTEPPIAGQMNAIVVNVFTSDGNPVADVSTLEVQLVVGGEARVMRLQPLGEDTPGQFVAPVLPAIPGRYTVELGGSLGGTQVSASVEPEAVSPRELVQFPLDRGSAQTGAFGLTGWLAVAGVILGLAGTALGLAGLRKTR